ncbi:MAG: DUF1902 domain-containing protein [Spirochaetota bacterium]
MPGVGWDRGGSKRGPCEGPDGPEWPPYATRVTARWNGGSSWRIANDDSLGLVAEADTVEVLKYKLQELIPELAELIGIDLPRPTRFSLVSHWGTVWHLPASTKYTTTIRLDRTRSARGEGDSYG